MAGKTKDMSQIKQLLLLKKEGVSNRKAAEIVGINKETANNYVRKALADRRKRVRDATLLSIFQFFTFAARI